MKQGYIQVYTGDGKGKTTAALGLSLRAAGAELKVYIIQFLKTGNYSEIKALERFSDLITVEQFGAEGFIIGDPLQKDIDEAQKGLKRVKEVMASEEYDVVIIEEGSVAVALGLISVEDLLELIAHKTDSQELVITGRNAAPEIIARADLVTEMKSVKHYYEKGIMARIGIEK